MMTYSEIISKHPLGCSVRLRPHEEFHNGEPFGWTPQGKILAVLDPSKHGPKCLLFKIESPKGRKISREKAYTTFRRKIRGEGKGFHIDKWLFLRNKNVLKEPDWFGTLKWLTPPTSRRGWARKNPSKCPIWLPMKKAICTIGQVNSINQSP